MNTPFRFSAKEENRIERSFARSRRAMEPLDIVAAEFSSDPMSVQCFDLRIVEEIKQLVAEQKREADWTEPLYQERKP